MIYSILASSQDELFTLSLKWSLSIFRMYCFVPPHHHHNPQALFLLQAFSDRKCTNSWKATGRKKEGIRWCGRKEGEKEEEDSGHDMTVRKGAQQQWQLALLGAVNTSTYNWETERMEKSIISSSTVDTSSDHSSLHPDPSLQPHPADHSSSSNPFCTPPPIPVSTPWQLEAPEKCRNKAQDFHLGLVVSQQTWKLSNTDSNLCHNLTIFHPVT